MGANFYIVRSTPRREMKNEIFLFLGVIAIIVIIYSFFNYDKLLNRHFKAYYLHEDHTVAKKALEFQLKVGFVVIAVVAILFLLLGFGII